MKCVNCDFDNPDNTRFCGNCGEPLQPTVEKTIPGTEALLTPIHELARGSTFAERYEVIEELGRGGMGRVYKVFDKKIKEKVALKLIKPEIAAKEKMLERFSNELRLARKITHKNVCRMYDLSEEKGIHYISMEYVPGEDLKSMIKMMGQLSAGQAIYIGKQICEGLAEAHRFGVVHRDLKPKNIMVDREGNVRIMDFGTARSLEEKGITGARVMIGTPDYMSPEQVEGKRADQRSDIYSLGVIFYEIMTGRLPFEADTPLGVALKQKTEAPPDPREFNAQIPEALVRVTSICMEKDKEKRYQNVEGVLEELKEIEKELPTTEKVLARKKPSTSREITVQFSLKKIFVPALVMLALMIIGIAVWRILLQKEEVPIVSGKPSLAVFYFKNNTGDQNLDNWRSGLSDLFITELQRSSEYITVLSPDSIFYILKKLKLYEAKSYSSEDLEKVSAKARATHILTGSYSMAGDNLRLIYDIKEASTVESIGSDRIDGKGEDDLHRMVDDLSKKILANLNLPAGEIPSEVDEKIGIVQPCFPLAYKYYQLGRHLERRYDADKKDKDFVARVEWYEKAIQEDPNCALAYWGLGDSYEARFVESKKKEDFDLMLKYYEEAYRMDSNLAGANAGLGWAYYYKEDLDQAYKHFKRAIEIEPYSSYINHNVGSFLRSIGLPGKAIKYYSKAIELDSLTFKTIRSHRLRATCYIQIGKFKEATDDIRKILEIEPDVGLQLYYARALIMMKKFDEAEKEIAIAEKLEPDNPNIKYTRAMIFASKGEKEKPLAIIRGLDPIHYTYLLSRVYAILDMKNEAIQSIKEGIDKGFEETQDYMYSYPILVNNYFYDNLRDDPRFLDILKTEKKKYEDKLKKYDQL